MTYLKMRIALIFRCENILENIAKAHTGRKWFYISKRIVKIQNIDSYVGRKPLEREINEIVLSLMQINIY